MKFKNKITIFLLFITILFFSSCLDGSTSGKQSGVLPFSPSNPTSTSSSGVSLEFAQNRPGNEIYKDSPAIFAFIFKNYQEHDITDFQMITKGFETGYVNGLDSSYSISKLPRASTQVGPGVYTGLVVSGVTVSGFEGDYNFNPIFEYCYTAQTNFRQQVCIPSDKNTCDVQVENSMKQNGPLNVKIDRIIPINNEIRVDFTVVNSGAGKVVSTCFDTEEYATDYTIEEVNLGSNSGSCSPLGSDEFKIIGNKAAFSCTFARSNSQSYASQISVKLTYKYDQEYRQKLIVKDLNVN